MSRYLSLLIPFFLLGHSWAQSQDSLISDVEELFLQTNPVLVFPTASEMDVFSMSRIEEEDSKLRYEIQKLELEGEALRNDYGLQLKAGATYYSRNTFDADNNNISSRARVELEWNILKMGWQENHNDSKQKQNEAKILNEQREEADKALWRRQFRLEYSFSIQEELIGLLEQKKEFLSSYFDIINQLYIGKEISREEVIQVANAISVTEKKLQELKNLNRSLQDSVSGIFKNKLLPIWELDSTIQTGFNASPIADSLNKENIRLKYHWSRDISLSVFVNQNWDLVNVGTQNFTGAGIRFKVPLRDNRKKEVMETELKLLQSKQRDRSVGKQNRLLTYYASYIEKIKDVKNKYGTWKVLEERKRKLMAQKEALGTQEVGKGLLALMYDQFLVLEDLLQLKRQLYTALSHLYEMNSSLKFKPLVLNKEVATPKVLVKIITDYSWDYQKHFLLSKGITELYVLDEDTLLKRFWEKEGFTVYAVSEKTEEIELKDWIKEECKTINRMAYEKVFIPKESGRNTDTEGTQD